MMSAIREIGTATSVDQTSVPSGRTARLAQSACFRADHRESMVSWFVEDSKERHPAELTTFFAALTLSSMACSVPENLRWSALVRGHGAR